MRPITPAPRRARLLWLIAFAGAVGACPDEASDSAAVADQYDAAASIPLELGTGRLAYESVAPFGESVELIHGPQGGFHIYGRYRFSGFTPDVYVSFRVTPAEGGAPINSLNDRVHRTYPGALQRAGDGWECSSPELVILTAIRGPADVVGRRFRWEVFVRSAATGAVATTAREVTIVDSL